jgi:hypothetical protein
MTRPQAAARAGSQTRARHGGTDGGDRRRWVSGVEAGLGEGRRLDGGDRRRWVSGVEAGLGEGRRAASGGGGGGGDGGGRRRRVSGAHRGRNGRVSPYAAARPTGRARGRAGQKNARNSPARPTRLFSPQSAHGELHHVHCSALETMGERTRILFWCFSYKNFCDIGSIVRPSSFYIQNPPIGTKRARFFQHARRTQCARAKVFHDARAVFWCFSYKIFFDVGPILLPHVI